MIERIHETIVAISSPPGRGTVGIVRLSGPDAMSISCKLVDTEAATAIFGCCGGERIEGEVYITDELSLPAAFLVFKSPKSYTSQDIVEIHTVGSPPALEMVANPGLLSDDERDYLVAWLKVSK